jgi:NADPH2:quinone reductase
MQALLCREFCAPEDLAIETAPKPHAGPGEVVVHVAAAGVNFPDALIIQGRYQVRPPFPFSPGVEVAGVVAAVGDGVDDFAPGMRVVAHPPFGAYAEYVAVDQRRVFPIPDAMDDVTAAGFLIPYGTSYHALKDRARLRPGETLLVTGAAGAIGLAAVELGALKGARVIAAASSADRLALCREYGAAETINYVEQDLRQAIRALTDDRGLDVAYDSVGGKASEAMLRSLAPYGRHLVLGFAAGEIPALPLNLVLLKRADVCGVFLGASMDDDTAALKVDVAELCAWYAAGKLRPRVARTYPLAQAAEAIRDVAERRLVGKAVLTV